MLGTQQQVLHAQQAGKGKSANCSRTLRVHSSTRALRAALPVGLGTSAAWGLNRQCASSRRNAKRVSVRASTEPSEDEGIFTSSTRESRLLSLGCTVLLEMLLTGGLFWSPLVCSLMFILFSPSEESMRQSKEDAIKQAVDEAKREAANRVPVTPPESAEFMNRLLAEIWVPFVVPQTLRDNLSAWQEKARMAAPKGWTLELTDFSLGVQGPVMSNFQVFNDPNAGRMQGMECNMDMNSSSMRVVVRGSGPLGDFRATVSGVNVKGKMRILPVVDQRMLLWSFVQPPDVQLKLQVKGPLIGEREVPQFSFIRNAIVGTMQDTLVEPRRAAASLDYENIGQQALDTQLNIFVESVNNLGNPPTSALASGASGDDAGMTTTDVTPEPSFTGNTISQNPEKSTPKRYGWPNLARLGSYRGGRSQDSNNRSTSSSNNGTSSSSSSSSANSSSEKNGDASRAVGLFKQLRNRTGSAVLVNATNLGSKLERRSATRLVNPEGKAAIEELLKVELGDKDGIINLQVRDASSRSNRSPSFGRVRLHIAAAKDGSTLMWCRGVHNRPLAQRWQPAMGPWRVTVPLENSSFPDASITLALSTDPWTYAQVAPMSAYKTPGARTVVLQVLEGRELPANDWAGTSDPYVELQYDQRTYKTPTLYNSQQPLWNETFVFLENPSLLTRTVRMAVRDEGVPDKTEAMGIASLSLDMALEATIQDRWVQLGGTESGELRVRMAVVAGAPESPTVQQMVSLLSSSDYAQASMPTLQAVAVAARNLPPRPSNLRLPSPNRSTFCGLSFGGSKQVTPVAIGSQNPTWNFTALFPLTVAPKEALTDDQLLAAQSEERMPGQASRSGSPSPPGSPSGTRSTRSPSPPGSPSGTRSTRPESVSTKTKRVPPGALVPGANRLRLEVFDSDMKPPGNSLGYVEVDADASVPQPGDTWEQWMPLKGNKKGSEVLVRVAHLSPFSGMQGSLPNPLEERPRGSATMNTHQAPRVGASTPVAEPPRAAEQILVDSFSEQVRLANLRASRASEGLRSEWGPKVLNWWAGVNTALMARQAALTDSQRKRAEEMAEKGDGSQSDEDTQGMSDGNAGSAPSASSASNGSSASGTNGSLSNSIAASAKEREAGAGEKGSEPGSENGDKRGGGG